MKIKKKIVLPILVCTLLLFCSTAYAADSMVELTIVKNNEQIKVEPTFPNGTIPAGKKVEVITNSYTQGSYPLTNEEENFLFLMGFLIESIVLLLFVFILRRKRHEKDN